jgi:hypothetical protein
MASVRRIAVLLLLALSACSIASDFKGPITQFSTATAQAESALQEFDKDAAKQLTDLRREDALKTPGQVRPFKDDCAPLSPGCRIRLFSSPDGEGDALTVESIVPEHLMAMHEIQLYAQGLQDIVEADATAAVKAGLDKASAAAADLAALAGAQYGAGVKALSVPVNMAAVWLFGEYQESIKLDALREATRRMETVLPDAVGKFGAAADLAHLAGVTQLAKTFGQKKVSFQTERSAAALDEYLVASKELDDALQVKPSDVFNQLGTAHNKLAAALQSDDIAFDEAILQMNRLVTKAEELVAIAKAFKKAGEKPQTEEQQ